MAKLLIATVALLALLAARPAAAGGLLIIVNPAVDVTAPMPLGQVAAIYLLRITTWPDGSHIVAVNREAASEARAKFTVSVLHQDSTTLAAYWNEMHFLGRTLPVVQESDQAVLAFVRNVPGAIGYIDASTRPENVKVVAHVP